MTFRDRGRRQVRFGGGVAFHEHQGEDLSGGVLSNILLSGDFRSTNWNGAIPADLSSAPDPVATAGFYLDSSAGVIQALGFYGVIAEPAGVIKAYGGTTAPTGYLLCNGAAVSRTTYAVLFAVIGTTFGVGDGSTTFNVPDLRGRFPLGKAASGTGSTLGGTGGAIDHTHAGPSHAHSGPSHTHTVSVSGDTGWLDIATTGVASGSQFSFDHTVTDYWGHYHLVAASGTTAADGTGSTGSAGTGATGTSNPPFIALNWLIKV